MGFPGGSSGKEPVCQCRRHNETWAQSVGWDDSLEEGMATHSSILAWRIPWTVESGRPQGSQRVGHDSGDLAHMHRKKQREKQDQRTQ